MPNTIVYIFLVNECLKILNFIFIEPPQKIDPCHPSPCGSNAQCDNGICTCLPDYNGDPYFGCRPECVLSTDCPTDKACMRLKCMNPCRDMCGDNAECNVYNHVAVCSCPSGMTGDAFSRCVKIESMYRCLFNTFTLEKVLFCYIYILNHLNFRAS